MFDVAVVGAGPAGLAAALAAAEAGLHVVLLDASARAGGQYFRHRAKGAPGVRTHGWKAFAGLRDAVTSHPRIDYRPEHRVWLAEPHLNMHGGFVLHVQVGERQKRPVEVVARRVVIAAGAHDRSLPFPGWDLPGVFTAGGVQALLKGNGVLAGRRVVVAGTGPFLLPVASGLAEAGARVVGVFDANRPGGRQLRMAVQPAKVVEAAGYAVSFARHRISYRPGWTVVAAHAGPDAAVEAVSVARLDREWNVATGSVRRLECDAVAVGYGFTPQLELPLQLGCATRLDVDGSLVADVDAAQRTSVPGVFAAGETTGVGGAELALIEGELAGLAVAGLMPGQELLGRRSRLRAFASAMHRAYPVQAGWRGWLQEDTLICRCEEVPYGRVTEAIEELGATDPRTVKLLTRAGMGWCQGRICGHATACLTGKAGDEPALRGLAKRPFAQPIKLGDLVQTEQSEEGSPR